MNREGQSSSVGKADCPKWLADAGAATCNVSTHNHDDQLRSLIRVRYSVSYLTVGGFLSTRNTILASTTSLRLG
jgi:hypothetical protein